VMVVGAFGLVVSNRTAVHLAAGRWLFPIPAKLVKTAETRIPLSKYFTNEHVNASLIYSNSMFNR